MKRVGQTFDVAVALVVAVFVIWFVASAFVAVAPGPVDPGECEYVSACD